jgi:zinc protease
VFGNETPSDRANLYGYFHSMMGNLQAALDYPQTIQTQEAIDLQQAARQYLPADAYGVVIIRPES